MIQPCVDVDHQYIAIAASRTFATPVPGDAIREKLTACGTTSDKCRPAKRVTARVRRLAMLHITSAFAASLHCLPGLTGKKVVGCRISRLSMRLKHRVGGKALQRKPRWNLHRKKLSFTGSLRQSEMLKLSMCAFGILDPFYMLPLIVPDHFALKPCFDHRLHSLSIHAGRPAP